MTNYLLVELTSKMEHQERLRQAEQLRKLQSMTLSIPERGRLWLQGLRDSLRSYFVMDQHPASNQAVNFQSEAKHEAKPRSLVATKFSMSEDEWLLLFRMIKSHKLSVEQAAQLLIAMS